MASTGVVSGSIMRVYTGNYTSETAVAYATDSTIEFSLGEIQISHKDVSNNWKAVDGGELSCTISTNALYANDDGETYTTLFTALTGRTNVYLKFSTEVSGDIYYFGSFLVTSLSINAANNESTTYSASFSSDGAISSGVVGTDDLTPV